MERIDRPSEHPDRLAHTSGQRRLRQFDRDEIFSVFPGMAAANASARGQRVAILASPLHELTGFHLAVDCLASGCNGERTFAIAELAR